jgi:hypothetical protein
LECVKDRFDEGVGPVIDSTPSTSARRAEQFVTNAGAEASPTSTWKISTLFAASSGGVHEK